MLNKYNTMTNKAENQQKTKSNMNEFLTINEAADLLRVSKRTLMRHVKAGRIKAYKPMGKLLFKKGRFDMHGLIQFTFTPEQLIKEMMSNVVDEILGERKARQLYGSKNINDWIREKKLTLPPNIGSAKNSKLEFHRIELEELKLKSKYLNKI